MMSFDAIVAATAGVVRKEDTILTLGKRIIISACNGTINDELQKFCREAIRVTPHAPVSARVSEYAILGR